MKIIVKHFNELNNIEVYNILKARSAIFVVEQTCIYQDIDDKDLNAYHVMVYDNNSLKAYARVLNKGVSYDVESIGRVITTERKKGYGLILMNKAIDVAKEKYNAKSIIISAQIQALGFYKKCGFVEFGESYLEDDIPHIHMRLDL